LARFGLLLARTDPEVPKHIGLSYFVLDLQAPGVEVRPLFDLTGEADFNEVFLTDVRIPADHMLAREGKGWKVATTTLMNERVALGGDTAIPRGDGAIRALTDLWERRRDQISASSAPAWRDRVTSLWIEAEVLRLTTQRANASRRSRVGPEGSVGKLMSAELNQRIYGACVDLQGASAMVHEPGYRLVRRDEVEIGGPATFQFLRSRANTIEGGTSEVMRNILGERVLDLPSDIRVDKDIPWNAIPR
jgi:alkylation response protein AidB-like acyl-CoA dehydrogenase